MQHYYQSVADEYESRSYYSDLYYASDMHMVDCCLNIENMVDQVRSSEVRKWSMYPEIITRTAEKSCSYILDICR